MPASVQTLADCISWLEAIKSDCTIVQETAASMRNTLDRLRDSRRAMQSTVDERRSFTSSRIGKALADAMIAYHRETGDHITGIVIGIQAHKSKSGLDLTLLTDVTIEYHED